MCCDWSQLQSFRGDRLKEERGGGDKQSEGEGRGGTRKSHEEEVEIGFNTPFFLCLRLVIYKNARYKNGNNQSESERREKWKRGPLTRKMTSEGKWFPAVFLCYLTHWETEKHLLTLHLQYSLLSTAEVNIFPRYLFSEKWGVNLAICDDLSFFRNNGSHGYLLLLPLVSRSVTVSAHWLSVRPSTSMFWFTLTTFTAAYLATTGSCS